MSGWILLFFWMTIYKKTIMKQKWILKLALDNVFLILKDLINDENIYKLKRKNHKNTQIVNI